MAVDMNDNMSNRLGLYDLNKFQCKDSPKLWFTWSKFQIGNKRVMKRLDKAKWFEKGFLLLRMKEKYRYKTWRNSLCPTTIPLFSPFPRA